MMPGGLPLRVSKGGRFSPTSKVLQVVKQKVSRSLRGKKTSSASQLELTFASDRVAAPAFWQRRFYDFNVWSEKKFEREIALYAPESRGPKIGTASARLAMEQLGLLRQG
jgi:hypothetical protein